MRRLAERAQSLNQMLAQLPCSLRGCRAQFLIASRHHHRKPVIVNEFHDRTLTKAGSEGQDHVSIPPHGHPFVTSHEKVSLIAAPKVSAPWKAAQL
jgi:hypothetical protein